MKKNVELYRIIACSFLLFLSFLNFTNGIVSIIMLLISYLIIGYDVIFESFKNIFHGEFFDEKFLMMLATIGAIAIGDYREAVAVMVFYQIGEYMSEASVSKSKKAIVDLMDLRSDFARLKKGEKLIKVDPETIKKGDIILIQPGEKVPLDGIVIEGISTLNTASITGEGVPQEVTIGDKVISGCVNLNGVLTVQVEHEFHDSTVSKILTLVENASERKTETERFMTKFSKIYTPIIVLCAFLLLIVPLLFGGDFSTWLYRSLVFLVISCPCALVISIPLGFFCGIGVASKHHILVKGSSELEKFTHMDTIVFDKTGTLTKGVFEVTEVIGINGEKAEVLELAAYAEAHSTHPIALAIQNKYGKELDLTRIRKTEEMAGKGIQMELDHDQIMVGNRAMLIHFSLGVPEQKELGTIVYVVKNNIVVGLILVSDELKPDIKHIISNLKKTFHVIMLSGDKKDIVLETGAQIGIDEVYFEMQPQDKVEVINSLKKDHSVIFVGDGINDAPVLALADLGISMGGIGSDAAIEASDMVVMNDDLNQIVTVAQIASDTLRIVKQNIIFAICIKIIFLLLGVFGISSIWFAVFADVGVTILVILNATRIFYKKYENDSNINHYLI